MDATVVRVANGLHLGVTRCRYHLCQQCRFAVDCLSDHGLNCRKSQGRFSRYAAIIDIVMRSLVVAKIPSHLEPSGSIGCQMPRWC